MNQKSNPQLRLQGFFIIGFLLVQYLLGILSNLYVQFPDNNTDWQHWHFAKGQLLIVAHIVVGMLLLIGMIVLYIRAFRSKDKIWKIASGIGLGSVLLAIMSGSEFISTQSAIYSFVMSVLFVIALGSIAWGLYKTR